jgi:RNA polymerase sigma-70 factor (ECF subfamily)
MIDCTNQLSDLDRELIRLRYANGVRVKTLAQQLQRSENAISQSLARIRKLLRECIERSMQKKDEGDVV